MGNVHEYEKEEELRREGKLMDFDCPDCGAILRIVSAEKLPVDIEIKFIKHLD